MYYKRSDTIKYHSKNICKVKLDDMSRFCYIKLKYFSYIKSLKSHEWNIKVKGNPEKYWNPMNHLK